MRLYEKLEPIVITAKSSSKNPYCNAKTFLHTLVGLMNNLVVLIQVLSLSKGKIITYYNHTEKGPTEEYPLLYSLVGNASNPFKGRHRSDQPIPCLTPSNVLPFYVTAETGSVECPGFAALSTLFK